jgi:opacity protein-like surface antigen
MKNLLLGATATLAIASVASAAYANHPFNPYPVTTGGGYMQQRAQYLREHDKGVQQSMSSSSQQKSLDTSSLEQLTKTDGVSSKNCQSVVPGGTTGGAIRQQLEAMAKCNSGS